MINIFIFVLFHFIHKHRLKHFFWLPLLWQIKNPRSPNRVKFLGTFLPLPSPAPRHTLLFNWEVWHWFSSGCWEAGHGPVSLLAYVAPGLKSLGPLPGFPPNSAQLRSWSVIIFALGVILWSMFPFLPFVSDALRKAPLCLTNYLPFLFHLSKDHSTQKTEAAIVP